MTGNPTRESFSFPCSSLRWALPLFSGMSCRFPAFLLPILAGVAAASDATVSEDARACYSGPACTAMGEVEGGSFSLLQTHSAAQHNKSEAEGARAASSEDAVDGAEVERPILYPLQPRELINGSLSPLWPYQVADTEEAKRTDAICTQAYQTAYDCHWIPKGFGGATCGCLDDPAPVFNCKGWYGAMMTGSWLVYPRNHYSVVDEATFDSGILMEQKKNETRATCLNAFQQAWDCTEIPPELGGAKYPCVQDNCRTWFGECILGASSNTVVPPHRHSVP